MIRAFRALALGAALLLGAAMPSAAQALRPVVVELFTSQGCSSCPPAEELLRELGMRDNVITLAYHVDYWDYLGWEDTFASPAFTERQRRYAIKVDRQHIERPLRGAFTPEMIIQGTDSLIGSARAAIEARIAAHAAVPPLADIALRQDGADLLVDITPAAARLPDMEVMLATYLPEASVTVTRGENAGRTLDYTHVVTDLRMIASWDGVEPLTLRVGGAAGPVVVFLQRGRAGPILAAAQLH